jgi:hypothetical protein
LKKLILLKIERKEWALSANLYSKGVADIEKLQVDITP